MVWSMAEEMKRRVLDAVASHHDAIRDFTRELVAIPTENPPGARYRECVDLISERLSELGITHEVIGVPSDAADGCPRYCILGSHGAGDRAVHFHGHYDVVPASVAGQFEPQVQNGNLFGRGSSDMKSGLAAMIYAVKVLEAANVECGGRIELRIVPDEETGGQLGSQHLAETGRLAKESVGMLLPEPTSGVVWNANRGAISLRVTVKGKPAHVGLHYKGRNAFEQMLTVADALVELKREVEARATSHAIEPEAARRSILMLGGRVQGGSNFNLVPGECSFTVDRRINPEEDLDTERQRLLEVFDLAAAAGIDLQVETLQEGESTGVSEQEPFALMLARNVEAVTGKPARFEMCPGLLDIRFYAKRGVPAFAYGPGLLSVSHGPNEFVKLDDVYRCAAIYALTALDALS